MLSPFPLFVSRPLSVPDERQSGSGASACSDRHYGRTRGEELPESVVRLRPDVVLAAECVYFEPAFPHLMKTLTELLALNEEAVVYFCFKKRRRADMQFVKMARRAFAVEELVDEDRPQFQRQAIHLYSLRHKHNGATATQSTAGR